MIEEIFKTENTITIAEFPAKYYSFQDIKTISRVYNLSDKPESIKANFKHCRLLGKFKNLVMAHWKDEYNIDLWNQAITLLITNQTSAPIPTETTPQTGIIHTITAEWETNRIVGNPYYISYGITAPEADGQWGSLCWVTESGELINRVRTAIRKDSGKILFLELKASIK